MSFAFGLALIVALGFAMAHARGRLSELYRGELTGSIGVREAYALVVVDASRGSDGIGGSRADVLTHALRAHRLGETVRAVFAGPETMETKIFGRLTAWQNWIFQRPNAVGPKGALQVYGTGERSDFDRRRV